MSQSSLTRSRFSWMTALFLLLSAGGIFAGFLWIFRASGRSLFSEAPAYAAIGLVVILTGALCMLAGIWLLLIRKENIFRFFVIAIVSMGILYLFLVPPMTAPDERNHFNSAYDMASEWYGVKQPKKEFHRYLRPADAEHWMLQLYAKSPADYETVFEDLVRTPSKEETSFTEDVMIFNNAGSLAYNLPAAMIYLGFLGRFSFIRTAMLATLPNLLIYLLGMIYAVKKTPYGKTPMALLALLPISLQQGASLSYDALLLSASFVITAIGMKWGFTQVGTADFKQALRRRNHFDTPRFTWDEVILFLLSAYALLHLKSAICAPLILLWPLMSLRKGMFAKYSRKQKIAAVLILAALAILWLTALGGADRIYHAFTDKPYLFHVFSYGRAPIYYLQHLDVLFTMLLNTLIREGRDILYQAFGGRLGWLHMYANHYITYVLVLVFLLMLIRSDDDVVILSPVRRFALIFVGIIPCLLSVAAMLFYHTTPDSDQILGIQGRYFLPTLLPLVLGILKWRKPVRRFLNDRILLLFGFYLTWLSAMSSYGFLSQF